MPSQNASSPRDISRPVVLVAEDEALIRFVLVTFLSDAGFTVLEASNADDAVTVLGSELPIDLVFTDINMPGDMNGDALAAWSSVHRPGLPVILTSAAVNPSDSNRRRRFIPKPYDLSDVENQIRELLQ